ncbi:MULTISPECIES: alpha/beta fold hydrolase [unclassified Bacillus (in: firmicutes)]|uniref:alpha/beta fold hydrolase n=1 Tax=unclassified Bacillus (in: firmicutes) TaxID=185979 RepID=UPI0008E42A97|nr:MULTISPECIES: alpha/beta hydrolase [unclassified Bacillus (in: firmicutes)]SFB24108.1 Pimeloyl-ACP methyl ester carboxylesterase [Bacillus sp. UNCCL13]SFQ91330.1 Pimeloyl-ACP methyl ester carboxylesterase [Bacillus sp. cl95]
MKEHKIYKNEHGKKEILNSYEEYLPSLDVPIEREYVDTQYGKTHVLILGPKDAKPLFIFQGGNCINPMTLSWFYPLFEEYRIYAPDTIGHPGYSDQMRISASDNSFAMWTTELLEHYSIEKCAFLGPSFGAGIILRLATFIPDKIACSVLVSPAGLKLGSKIGMIKKILLPLLLLKVTSNRKYMARIADNMSYESMKDMDKSIIANIFKHVKLEREMPKLTTKGELKDYSAPTLVMAGNYDVFFPAEKIKNAAADVIPNLVTFKSYDMGHFPSPEYVVKINDEIKSFLREHY